MLRNFLTTTATRLIIAFLNFVISWISARYLGAEEFGTISLIVLGISIIQMATAVMAGSSLVYQVPRHFIGEIFLMALGWILISSIPIWGLLVLLKLIPEGYIFQTLFLAIIGSIFTAGQNILLGQENVQRFNALAVLQSITMAGSFALLIWQSENLNANLYVYAQFISIVLSLIASLSLILPLIHSYKLPKRALIIEAFKFGGYLQAASLMQLFNYRFSYYLIERYFDRATLGVFSLGVQIAESVWLISKSMAVLLYSRISNSRDSAYAINLTLNFIKITSMVTVILISFIAILPGEVFSFIFNKQFDQVSIVITSMAPGIVALSVSLMLSHYFSGSGNPKHNTISSAIGLTFTIILGLILIPKLGYIGAGIVASISYLTSMLYQLIVFKDLGSLTWSSFRPTNSDYSRMKSEISYFIYPKKNENL